MGKLLLKIVVVPLLYFISIFPFWVLFGISDFFYVLVYYVIGYRKKVVLENLKRSFPQKSDAEQKKIARQFYRHFCDTIFETLKTITISKENFKKHCAFSKQATAIAEHYEKQNRAFICVLGHSGNWEWNSIAHEIYFKVPLTGIYHPLSNTVFDHLIFTMRTRFGGIMVPMKNTFRVIIEQKKRGFVSNLGLISDQTPPPEGAYWTTFLNQDTPVFYGTEKIATKFDYAVVFFFMKKIKRGKYEIDAEVLVDQPAGLPEGAISELHTRKLEEKIREQPYTWLWSHRRWKHKRAVQ